MVVEVQGKAFLVCTVTIRSLLPLAPLPPCLIGLSVYLCDIIPG